MSDTVKAVQGALTAAMQNAIAKTAQAWQRAQDTVTKRRVDFGRAVGKAQVAIMAAGGTDEDCQSLIFPTIVEAIGHTVEWETVKQWVTAAHVFDSLPESVRENFSTEALKTLNGIPTVLNDKQKESGRMDRASFAELAVQSGATSVRDLREAVKGERSLTGESKSKQKGNAVQAEDAVKALKALVSDETHQRFEGITPDVITAAVMIGVFLRDKCPKQNTVALAEGVAQFFTPESDAAPSDDGSGAEDAA